MKPLPQPSPEVLVLEPYAGLCKIELRTYVSSGTDPECNPGIGINCTSEMEPIKQDGEYWFAMGVLSRSDAAKLRDYLEIFVKANL